LGVETGTMVQALDGLAPGDTVATAGGYGLPAGTPVRVEPSLTTMNKQEISEQARMNKQE